MATSRDTTAPNWARALPRLLVNIAELRHYGCEIVVPEDFETTPRKVVPPRERAYSRGTSTAERERD